MDSPTQDGTAQPQESDPNEGQNGHKDELAEAISKLTDVMSLLQSYQQEEQAEPEEQEGGETGQNVSGAIKGMMMGGGK